MVLLRAYFEGGRYERYQRVIVLKGDTARLPFFGFNWTGNAAARALSQQSYSLLVDGKVAASASVVPGASTGEFELDLSRVQPGWRELQIQGAFDETSPAFPVFVQGRVPVFNEETVPVSLGTYGLVFDSPAVHWVGRVPSLSRPRSVPLPGRETPPTSEALSRGQVIQTRIAPTRPNDIHRLRRTTEGLLATANTQWYFWSDFIAKVPGLPLLDGPRGVGTVGMATHLQVGRRDIYFCDPWRVGKVSPDGTVTTLAGFRHQSVPTFGAQDPPHLELVGDWSAIHPSRRGFHELWGLAWDERTLVTDENAAPIASEANEKPHRFPPVAFVADTQNNRVCKLEFSPSRRDVPVRVSEFAVGLADPWDVVCTQGVLYVSERTAHRISMFDASTGQSLGALIQGPDLAVVTSQRFPSRRVPRETVRAASIVAPEGMALLDGWLYFGSRAMEQVRRVRLADRLVEVVANVPMDSNSNFAKIAVSDGTFGPRGSVFVAHWSVLNYGYPHAFLPNGTEWRYLFGGQEAGPPFVFSSYPTAVAVGSGKLLTASATEGLNMLSRALPSDRRLDRARHEAGARKYLSKGLNLLHGHAGWGLFGLPLPWGIDPDIDYYLQAEGHAR
jgi:hypothetical protein